MQDIPEATHLDLISIPFCSSISAETLEEASKIYILHQQGRLGYPCILILLIFNIYMKVSLSAKRTVVILCIYCNCAVHVVCIKYGGGENENLLVRTVWYLVIIA